MAQSTLRSSPLSPKALLNDRKEMKTAQSYRVKENRRDYNSDWAVATHFVSMEIGWGVEWLTQNRGSSTRSGEVSDVLSWTQKGSGPWEASTAERGWEPKNWSKVCVRFAIMSPPLLRVARWKLLLLTLSHPGPRSPEVDFWRNWSAEVQTQEELTYWEGGGRRQAEGKRGLRKSASLLHAHLPSSGRRMTLPWRSCSAKILNFWPDRVVPVTLQQSLTLPSFSHVFLQLFSASLFNVDGYATITGHLSEDSHMKDRN